MGWCFPLESHYTMETDLFSRLPHARVCDSCILMSKNDGTSLVTKPSRSTSAFTVSFHQCSLLFHRVSSWWKCVIIEVMYLSCIQIPATCLSPLYVLVYGGRSLFGMVKNVSMQLLSEENDENYYIRVSL